ncbi:MAG TPA: hypothetical protein DD490_32190 [Acidobacteria bacterium]|nr:hypothetical protein [Acidobacteriota bacterium]
MLSFLLQQGSRRYPEVRGRPLRVPFLPFGARHLALDGFLGELARHAYAAGLEPSFSSATLAEDLG